MGSADLITHGSIARASSDAPAFNTCDPVYGPTPSFPGNYEHRLGEHYRGKFMIAAAGDSITFGHGASKPANSWPSIVAKKLGSRFVVNNLGRPSLTVQASTAEAYSRTEQYQHLSSAEYSAYIWSLGTNDARYSGWVEACVADPKDPAPASADLGHRCPFERAQSR